VARDRENYNKYQRIYQLDRFRRRKQEAIAFLGGKCVVCETTENLEIDHIDRTLKNFSVSEMWAVKEERFYAELRKCQLLCKSHHLEKTIKESSVPHGGGVSGKKNCPCILCKQKKAEYMTAYSKRRVR
jgi:hypothetical protein